MNNDTFDKAAVDEYHNRRRKYAAYGYNPYDNAEFIVSLTGSMKAPVLEVGTGRGLVTSYLARSIELITLDVDPEIQAFAKELAKSEGVYKNITFVLRDILKEPYPDGSFDTVISANAVHHFVDAEKMIKEICRISSRRIIIADFNEEGFEILSRLHREEGSDHNKGSISTETIGGIMRSEGLNATRHERFQTIAFVGEKKTP